MPAAVFKIPFFSPGSGTPHVLSAKAAASDAFNPLFMLSATDPLTELAKAPLSSVLNTPAEPAIAAAPAAPPKTRASPGSFSTDPYLASFCGCSTSFIWLNRSAVLCIGADEAPGAGEAAFSAPVP